MSLAADGAGPRAPWILQVRAVPVLAVAASLGLQTHGRGGGQLSFGPCPVCCRAIRSTEGRSWAGGLDTRGPCIVLGRNNGWRC